MFITFRIMFGLLVLVLGLYGWMTGNYSVLPYMFFILSLMLIFMGFSEWKSKRKGIAIILFVASASCFYVSLSEYSKEEFVIGATSYISMDAPIVEERLPFYIGYGIHWEGIGKPTLTNVTLIKQDGTELNEEDIQISVTSMIDEMGVTGVIDEESVIKEGYINEYLPVENYKVDDNFQLVYRVELHDSNYENNISHLIIEYKNFGFRQQQTMDFEGFFKGTE